MFLSATSKSPPQPLIFGGGSVSSNSGFFKLLPACTPFEARQYATAARDFSPEDIDTRGTKHLSLRKDELVTVVESPPGAGWWLCFNNSQPERVGLVPNNFIDLLTVTVCFALYDWPQEVRSNHTVINSLGFIDSWCTFRDSRHLPQTYSLQPDSLF